MPIGVCYASTATTCAPGSMWSNEYQSYGIYIYIFILNYIIIMIYYTNNIIIMLTYMYMYRDPIYDNNHLIIEPIYLYILFIFIRVSI